jgi:hypothetical protein
MRKGLIAALAVVGIVLILGARLAKAYYEFDIVERNFVWIRTGQSRPAVTAMLGKPNHHSGKCGRVLDSPSGCAVEYVYASPLAHWLPEYYVVWFSSEDRVIGASFTTLPQGQGIPRK